MTTRGIGMVICALVARVLPAQLGLQSVMMEPMAVGPTTFMQLSMVNDGPSVSAHVEGEVETLDGEQVLEVVSRTLAVPTGMSHWSPSDLGLITFRFGNGPVGSVIGSTHQLPGGTYRFCMRVIADAEMEGADELCDEFGSEPPIFLELVHPWDGDTVQDTRPTLQWSLVSPFLDLDLSKCRLVVSEIPSGSSAMAAISGSRPWFVLEPPAHPLVSYPSGLRELNKGSCYAWQAELVRNGLVTERSDVWRFCVANETVRPDIVAVLGDVQRTSLHEAFGGVLHFRFDEPYSSDSLKCQVFDHQRNIVRPSATRVNDENDPWAQNLKRVGTNLYQFHADDAGLAPGTYELVVWDEMKREYGIRFRVTDEP